VYYLRTRAYSRTISVSPFVINYSGAVFREYPAPWQVMIKQNTGGGLHLFPFQLNLSSSVHRITQLDSRMYPGVAQVELQREPM
jgi:hypothetical protein